MGRQKAWIDSTVELAKQESPRQRQGCNIQKTGSVGLISSLHALVSSQAQQVKIQYGETRNGKYYLWLIGRAEEGLSPHLAV